MKALGSVLHQDRDLHLPVAAAVRLLYDIQNLSRTPVWQDNRCFFCIHGSLPEVMPNSAGPRKIDQSHNLDFDGIQHVQESEEEEEEEAC